MIKLQARVLWTVMWWLALATPLLVKGARTAAEGIPRPSTPNPPVLLFCSDSKTNDLYQAARRAAARCKFAAADVLSRADVHDAHAACSTVAAAVRWAPIDACVAEAATLPNRSGVLFLADGAPNRQPVLPEALLDLLDHRQPHGHPPSALQRIRLYAEYAIAPSSGAAGFVGLDPHPCPDFARVVAHPGSALWTAGTNTKPLDVFEPNTCTYIPYWPTAGDAATADADAQLPHGASRPEPTPPAAPHLVLAKVAGFTTAVFGLNGTATIPVLTTPPAHPGLLLASLPLSAVRRARYSPAASWQGLWRDLLRWLLFNDGEPAGDQAGKGLLWTPVVGASYTANAILPQGAVAAAVRASLRWVHTVSRLLPTAASYAAASALGLWGKGLGGPWLAANGWPSELTPLGCSSAGTGSATGNGSSGIYEAYMSAIQPRGAGVGGNLSTQLVRPVVRTDCVGEAAGGLAVGAWAEFADARATAVAANLLDFLFFNSTALASWSVVGCLHTRAHAYAHARATACLEFSTDAGLFDALSSSSKHPCCSCLMVVIGVSRLSLSLSGIHGMDQIPSQTRQLIALLRIKC